MKIVIILDENEYPNRFIQDCQKEIDKHNLGIIVYKDYDSFGNPMLLAISDICFSVNFVIDLFQNTVTEL